MAQHTLTLELGDDRSYDIAIGGGLHHNAGELLAPHITDGKLIIITDENIPPALRDELEGSIAKRGIRTHIFTIRAGEGSKSFDTIARLSSEVLRLGIERRSTLIALGGGVVGDITGFLASILLRGINFIQIPTTLLSMVDSSVGGKTGINTKEGKNLVGSFHQPRYVIIDTDFLATLPTRELRAGYAEVVKYGLICDAEFFSHLQDVAGKSTDLQGDIWRAQFADIIYKSCKIKADIVSRDEREGGVRALLNLGHTFGHALEAEMGYDGRLLHGEAIAAGMCMAFGYSAQTGICPAEDADMLRTHLQHMGLPTRPSDIGKFDAGTLISHMRRDKKVSGGKMTFILARAIGDAFITKDVDEGALADYLNTPAI